MFVEELRYLRNRINIFNSISIVHYSIANSADPCTHETLASVLAWPFLLLNFQDGKNRNIVNDLGTREGEGKGEAEGEV